MKIGEREVELKTEKTFWRNSPDETLSLKSWICTINIDLETKENPRLGLIWHHFHSIELVDHTLFGCNGYKILLKWIEHLNEELKSMLELGIIMNSNSQCISPCFPILKKNGKMRLIIDYRRLNKVTVRYYFPVP